MSGNLLKYLDDIVRGFRSANEIASARAVLGGLSNELDAAFKASDSKTLDDLIRRFSESGTEAERFVFNNANLQRSLRSTRSRVQFLDAFDQARVGTTPVNIDDLRKAHGLEANDPTVRAARRVLETKGQPGAAAGTLEERLARVERDSRSLNAFNWIGRYNRAINRAVEATPGVLKPAVWIAGKAPMGAVVLIGAGGTVMVAGGAAHLATGGESTRAAVRFADDTLNNAYHAIQDIAPDLAEWLKQRSPEMTRLAFTISTLDVSMARAAFEELDQKHNIGIGGNSGLLAEVAVGSPIMAAYEHVTGVRISGEDLERVMRGMVNETDKRAYVARELSRMTGRSESQFAEALASPDIADVSHMTPQQILERFGQTSTVSPGAAAAPSTVSPDAAGAAAAPTLIDRARTALQRRTAQVRGVAETAAEQAAETVRIGGLSGAALNEEFNRVAESKNLNWFSSPQMFFIKLMDSIGFDFFGLNNMLKKQVLLDNVKTQFGDQFGILRQRDPALNLDVAPAPGT